jgi:carboxymethylenebutenolidase
MGLADEEVSPRVCKRLVERSRGKGGDIDIVFYDGAEHSFDTPTRSRQRLSANARAKADAMARAVQFFAEQLGVGESAR